MLCQNFISVPAPYRTPGEWNGIPSGIGLGSLYNAYLVTPPRLYAESIGGPAITGMWVEGDVVSVCSWLDMIYWPGWNSNVTWKFNVTTGAFIERDESGGLIFGSGGWVVQGVNGKLYLNAATSVTPIGPAPDYGLLTDEAVYPATYADQLSFNLGVFFDEIRNRAVMGRFTGGIYRLRVFEFASGTMLREMAMPDSIRSIVHEQGTRIFVLLANNTIVSLDYETGQFYSYVKIPQIGVGTSIALIAWLQRFRRMLVVEWTPDNVDGSSTTLIRGFRYVDIPVHVCKPIPLTRLRNGKRSAVLCKQVGDMGEGIGGLLTLTSTNTSGQVTRGNVALDGDGEGYGEVLGTAEGSETISVEGDVACLL